MLLCFILYFVVHLVFARASPDAWSSTSMSATSLGPEGQTISIVAYPIDPSNSEHNTAASEALRTLCGSDNVQWQPRTDTSDSSWTVTVADSTTATRLSALPHIRLEDTMIEHLRLFAKRDDPIEYVVEPKDFKNDTETKAIRDFLETKTGQPKEIYTLPLPGTSHTLSWGRVFLDAAAKKEVEAFPGVDEVYVPEPGELDGVVPDRGDIEAAGQSMKPRTALERDQTQVEKRADSMKWTKQTDAEWNLRMVSQPEGTKRTDIKDFVYPEKAGEGTWIYVIDSGVAHSVKNTAGNSEFPRKEIMQTELSKKANENKNMDDNPDSHGTGVAALALGQQNGVAKKATLVSVKIRSLGKFTGEDLCQAIVLIIMDLRKNPDRQPKSVVVTSTGYERRGSGLQTKMDQLINSLLSLGVPFISSAGNDASNKKNPQPNIHMLPKILEGPNTPIINVGACDINRQKAKYSQAGPHLTVYAPGGSQSLTQLTLQSKRDGKTRKSQGTSYAAPQVAGVIATYLAYDPLPWDKALTAKDRVKAIKAFLVSDVSSWDKSLRGLVFANNVRSVWNGATKEDHRKAGASIAGNSHTLNIIGATLDKSDNPAPPTAPYWIVWQYFQRDLGGKVNCEDNYVFSMPLPARLDGPSYPGGTWDLTLDGRKCQYKNSGDNAGKLFCENDGNPHDCKINARADADAWKCGDYWRKLTITCDF